MLWANTLRAERPGFNATATALVTSREKGRVKPHTKHFHAMLFLTSNQCRAMRAEFIERAAKHRLYSQQPEKYYGKRYTPQQARDFRHAQLTSARECLALAKEFTPSYLPAGIC